MSNLKNSTLTDTEKLIIATEALGVTGNIIPPSWAEHIQFEKGKPDFLGMMLLAEIIYWHRPEALARDEDGNIIKWKKRFSGEKLHRSRESLAKKFFVSTRQIGDALARLEKSGFIQRTTCYQTNRLYLTLVASRVAEIIPVQKPKLLKNNHIICAPIPKKSPLIAKPSVAPENLSSTDPLLSNEPPKVINRSSYKEIEISKENKKKEEEEEERKEEHLSTPDLTISSAASSSPIFEKTPSSSAQVNLGAEDAVIGETLTANQKTLIRHKFTPLIQSGQLLFSLEAMEAGFLDRGHFSNCGTDFHYKLNTFKKSVERGTWSPPMSFYAKHEAAKNREEQSAQHLFQEMKARFIKCVSDYKANIDFSTLGACSIEQYDDYFEKNEQLLEEINALQAKMKQHSPEMTFNELPSMPARNANDFVTECHERRSA